MLLFQVFRTWGVTIFFILIGPFAILWFRLPGSTPSAPPIITVVHQLSQPLPLAITLNKRFEVVVHIDISPLSDRRWQNLNINFPKQASKIRIIKGEDVINFTPSAFYLFKKYEVGTTQLNIKRSSLENLLKNRFKEDVFNCSIEFTLEDAIINHSFSNKSLALFYLSMPTNKLASMKTVTISLNTPINFVLVNSIPSPQRILPFKNKINYDFELTASDSGMLFNFTDTSNAIFEEIALFVISSVFGFFSGLIIERIVDK